MPSPLQLEIGANFTGDPAFDSADRRLKTTGAAAGELAEPLAKVVELGKQMSTAFAFTTAGLAGFGVGEILSFNSEITKTAALMDAQAKAVGLTTDQLQAYQAAARSSGSNVDTMQKTLGTFNDAMGKAAQGSPEAAKAFIDLGVKILDAKGNIRDTSDVLTETARALLAVESPATRAALATTLFGREGKQITPILQEIAQGMGALQSAAQDTGQVLSGSTIATLAALQTQSDVTRVRIANLWAQLATPITLQALLATKAVLEGIAAVIRDIQERGDQRQARLASNNVDDLQKQLDNQNTLLNHPARKGADNTAILERIAGLQERIATAKKAQAAANETVSDNKINGMLGEPPAPPLVGDADFGVKGGAFAQPKTSGRDHIQEEIDKYTAEAKSAQAAIAILLNAPPGMPLDKLQQASELAKKIGDAEAAAGKTNPNDPRIGKLDAQITSAVTLQQQLTRLNAAFTLADQTSAKYGDGMQELINRQSLLQVGLEKNRLSQSAYTAAMIEATQAQAEQALKAQQYTGGLQGLSAGFQYAALSQSKSLTAFNIGSQLYTNSFQLMKSAVSDWATTGVFNFQKVEQGFAMMLANMLAQAAQNQLSQVLFGGSTGGGGGGGLLGALFSSGGGAGGAASSGISDGISSAGSVVVGGAAAVGGRTPTGVPITVGELGPETFVPDQPGQIVPNGGSLGGRNVTMHNYYSFGSDVDRGTLKTWGEQVRKASVASVMNELNRAGPMRAAARK